MKQVNKKKEAIIWLILLLPFIHAFIVWSKLPDLVPTHFNVKGEPDDYSKKGFCIAAAACYECYYLFYPFFYTAYRSA